MAGYISREAVINITAETGAWETQNRVRELPVADVQLMKHGKWERLVSRQSGLNYEVGARCSCCNEHTLTICICELMPFEFCPHCGARMDGDRWTDSENT